MLYESEHWVPESMYPVTDCTRSKSHETNSNYDVYGYRCAQGECVIHYPRVYPYSSAQCTWTLGHIVATSQHELRPFQPTLGNEVCTAQRLVTTGRAA
eukprot:2815458-Pleurochrysis_carterae.AAC.1